MEDIIVTGIVGLCVSLLVTAQVTQKVEERKVVKAKQAKADAWRERLEVARLARESHPEDFVPGSVELPDYM